MSNDLKILKIVEKIDTRLDSLEHKFEKLENKFDFIDTKVTGMNGDIGEIKSDVKELQEKMDIVIDRLGDHEPRISLLEAHVFKGAAAA